MVLYLYLLCDHLGHKAEGEKNMKQNLHPEYHQVTVVCSACGAEIETGSTKKELKNSTSVTVLKTTNNNLQNIREQCDECHIVFLLG